MTTPAVTHDRAVLADLIPGERVRDVALVIGGAALTGLAAQVSIPTPLSPVPFTLQTMAVLMVGGALGPLRGALSMLVYAAIGSLGVPWFADQTSGFGGATYGYVLGFILAAGVSGMLARRGADRKPLTTIGLMIAGNVVIYAIGATWLAVSLGVSLSEAISLGVTPFLATDALKIAMAAVLMPTAWHLLRRNR